MCAAARQLRSRFRLLITGTPIQNSLDELWVLINFLLPDVFPDRQHFRNTFAAIDVDGDSNNATKLLHSLNSMLRPIMLRRLKSQVLLDLLPKHKLLIYTRLTGRQEALYRAILQKEEGQHQQGEFLPQNLGMQLRKAVNHPWLCDPSRDIKTATDDDEVVRACGKMIVLDQLLSQLQRGGHRVLLFSQMTRMLTILETYLKTRGFPYCRIDGKMTMNARSLQIQAFNREGSPFSVFLLSTRAGGVGINLATADTVILYDSDWNPQMDLQAMDRAHRIGQTKQVNVIRLITLGTIELAMLSRAEDKLRLDAMVIERKSPPPPAVTLEDAIGQARVNIIHAADTGRTITASRRSQIRRLPHC